MLAYVSDAMLQQKLKQTVFLLHSFITYIEQNGTDILAQFENMSRCFPVSVYLARQVNDAKCHDLAGLCNAPFCFCLIILPTRRLVQIRPDKSVRRVCLEPPPPPEDLYVFHCTDGPGFEAGWGG